MLHHFATGYMYQGGAVITILLTSLDFGKLLEGLYRLSFARVPASLLLSWGAFGVLEFRWMECVRFALGFNCTCSSTSVMVRGICMYVHAGMSEHQRQWVHQCNVECLRRARACQSPEAAATCNTVIVFHDCLITTTRGRSYNQS